MSTISRRCRACGAVNRPNATVCHICGRRFVAPNQRQQVLPQQQQKATSQQRGVYGRRVKSIMDWRSPRFLILYLIVFLALVIGVGAVTIYLRNASTDITIVWQTSPTSFSQQDRQDIQNAWEADLLTSSSNPGANAGHQFTIINAQRQGDWAIFSANERESPSVQPIATEPTFFLAHLESSNWTVWTPSSTGFCQELKQLSDTLLDSGDKHYFLGCYR